MELGGITLTESIDDLIDTPYSIRKKWKPEDWAENSWDVLVENTRETRNINAWIRRHEREHEGLRVLAKTLTESPLSQATRGQTLIGALTLLAVAVLGALSYLKG